jgi:hypothetical protein
MNLGNDTKSILIKRINAFELLLKPHNPGCNGKEYPEISNQQRVVMEDELVILNAELEALE